MPSIKCPHCGNGLKVPDSVIGKTGKCPKCQQKFVIELPKPVEPLKPVEDSYDLTPLENAPLASAPLLSAMTALNPAPLAFASAGASATDRLGSTPATAAPARPAWIVPAAIGGGVLALFLVAGVVVAAIAMFGGGGNGGAAQAGGGPAAAAGGAALPPGKANGLIQLTREADVGENSPVVPAPLVDADPAGWKVTVDGVPLASGLQSALPLRNRGGGMLFFSSPASARAAVIYYTSSQGIEWTQYDLKQPNPVGQVRLFPQSFHESAPPVAALSPSGERLALLSPLTEDKSPGVVYVCGTDGQQLARIELTLPSSQITWVGMPDESRVLVLAGDRVRAFDVSSGLPRFEIIGVQQPPTLSPGGKWLAAIMVTGVRMYSTAEGLEAGHLPIPEKWFEPMPGRNPRPEFTNKRIGRVAIDPSGKQAVLLISNPYAELYVANWDLATGKALGAFLLPWSHTQADLAPQCIWAGERQILLASGHLVDLDAQTWVAEYALRHFFPQSPDGRYWRNRELSLQEVEAVLPKLTPQQAELFQQSHSLLAATTIPTADVKEQIAQAKHGLLWHPGLEVRLEIAGRLPAEERDATLQILSDLIVKMGYRINPQAKYAIRTNIGVEDGLVVVRTEPHAEPNMEWHFYGQGSKGKVMWSVVDQQYNPLFAVPGWIEVDRAPKAGGEKAAWAEIRRRLWEMKLPRVYFRDAAGKRLPLAMHVDRKIPVGIDGLLDTPQPDNTATDSFELPADRGH
jgi:hypothetical protein